MTIYFLVILPLPTKEEVIKMKVINPQLIPLTFIKDIIEDLIELNFYIYSFIKILKNKQLLYDKILNIKYVSTIKVNNVD